MKENNGKCYCSLFLILLQQICHLCQCYRGLGYLAVVLKEANMVHFLCGPLLFLCFDIPICWSCEFTPSWHFHSNYFVELHSTHLDSYTACVMPMKSHPAVTGDAKDDHCPTSTMTTTETNPLTSFSTV